MTDENNQRIQCPTPDELSILVQHMNMYFSFPERSIYRNKIAQKASESLTKISKKWTHRTVRLWFNNNRSQYNINENENVNLNRPIYSSESNIKLFLEQNEYEYLTKKILIFLFMNIQMMNILKMKKKKKNVLKFLAQMDMKRTFKKQKI